MPEYVPWIVLAVVNIPIYLVYGKLLFGGWEGFFEAVVFWLKPDIWSLFKGEWLEDWWAELKLGVFVATCIALVSAEYFLIVGPLLLGQPVPAEIRAFFSGSG